MTPEDKIEKLESALKLAIEALDYALMLQYPEEDEDCMRTVREARKKARELLG